MQTIRPQRLTANAFARYGSVVRRPDTAPLAQTDAFSYWSDVAAYTVDGATEIGYCTVYRRPDARVGWMERHARTPELLVPLDGPFLLPVMADDAVEAFRVEPGEAVVIGEGVWHSACLPADGADEATYLVVFRRGTPHEDVQKTTIPPTAVIP